MSFPSTDGSILKQEEIVEDELKKIEKVIAEGPFNPAWDSLLKYKVPDWYENAKFGIFIHWGVYSVPAFGNEWYPRNMYQKDTPEFRHHIQTYGPHSKFGYKDFIPMFKAEKFSPAHWAKLFKKAGAKYVVPVAEHHDGFAMYDCAFSRWTAVKMGPGRDIIGELGAAVCREGLVYGVSNHRAEHWWFMDGGMQFDSDVRDPEYFDFYGPAHPKPDDSDERAGFEQPDRAFLEEWLVRLCELVDKYQPQIVWFDWWINRASFVPYLQKFAAYYYNRGAQWKKGVVINYKFNAYPPGAAVLDIERGQLKGISKLFWQTDTSISKNSWGYITNHDYKTAGSIIGDMIDIVSKNGALLLNIGPRPDGTIPEYEEQVLLEIGKWLELNGEAIYETHPWEIFGEGPTEIEEGTFTDFKRSPFTAQDIRFTTRGNVLYAILLAWAGNQAVIKSLHSGRKLWFGEISSINMLGVDRPLEWSRDENGLRVQMPAQKPCEHAFVLKISGA